MSQAPNITFSGQLWKEKTVLRVKIVESTGNIHWKPLSLLSSFVLLQVIHQGNEFWTPPKEFEFLANVREIFIY